ncbi:HU family DNA-binding protein [Mesorhizobium sp. M0437]|uniref:HU family DNA-binding protein n=1 Tax=unclassified Mesorhizobium TaxID=325217 RepID=UPI003336485F
MNKAQAQAIVKSVFKQISDAAGSGAETSIPGFGKFKVKDTPAREGRDPSTEGGGQVWVAYQAERPNDQSSAEIL